MLQVTRAHISLHFPGYVTCGFRFASIPRPKSHQERMMNTCTYQMSYASPCFLLAGTALAAARDPAPQPPQVLYRASVQEGLGKRTSETLCWSACRFVQQSSRIRGCERCLVLGPAVHRAHCSRSPYSCYRGSAGVLMPAALQLPVLVHLSVQATPRLMF